MPFAGDEVKARHCNLAEIIGAYMKFSWTTTAMCFMAATAGLQIVDMIGKRTASGATVPYIDAKIGARLDVAMMHNSNQHQMLSDIGAGSCRYVVVLSPTCGASIGAVSTWQKVRQSSVGEPEVPRSWQIIWVSLGDSIAARVAFSTYGDKSMWLPVLPGTLENALRIRAYPVHVILNRGGDIVGGDVGVRLLPLSSYHDDCTITEPPAS